jgi:TubC N-terminal docking domain
MTALPLLHQLHALGVVLAPSPDGTVRCRAPKGILTPALVDAMRQHKTELHTLVEEWSERAAIAEYCGGLSRPAAEALAWQCVLDIIRNNDIMGGTQHYQNQGLLRRSDTDALLSRSQIEPSGAACLHQFRPRRV